ncbi:MAG: M3 family metallopeptidase [Verrucomicrobiota bacterium]
MESAAAPSDRWSLESWFSAFGAPDYLAFKDDLTRNLTTRSEISTDGDVTADLAAFEELSVKMAHLSAFLGCLSADDSNNEAVKADEAWLSGREADLSKIEAALRSRLAALTDAQFAALTADSSPSSALADAAYRLSRLREAGARQMPLELEGLAADLNVDGLHAWGRLYETLTGKLSFPMTFPDGHTETVPMSRRRALMASPERAVRSAAFHAGQQPWLDHADTFAAGLNGIAGARLSLYRRRGQPGFLEAPLFDSAMSAASLDAMMEAIHAHIEIPRRALRAAARLQGTPALHFFDLEAPQIAAPGEAHISWDQACAMVDRAFTTAYPALGAYFREMLDRRWIEAQPRAGKRPGAFCTGSPLRGEERVYMNYHGTVQDVITLAHEVGHAWHSRALLGERLFRSSYPMTLAETASNFGEMILLEGLLSEGADNPALQAWLLDQEMNRAHSYLVNIPMRFEFERSFYTERHTGEVPVSRLRTLMEQAQRKCYGDTLESDGLDPLFWCSKMHFFISSVSFYNFPYVFGYLLSRALFARFQAEGPAFLPGYEAFLRLSGSADCETTARQTLNADLTDPAFWASGILSLEPKLAEYEAITATPSKE